MQKMKLEDLRNKIDKNMVYYQTLLKKVIKIPSVKGEPLAQAPFGKQPRKVLQQVLIIAEQLGLKTKQLNDQVGWAELTGESVDYVAALGHLDVVAAPAQGWKTDPFDLAIKDDYMYGRGVLDNKGPIMGALFALALLKEEGFKPKQSIRVIFGTDEESGSRDMKTYNLSENPPIAGFTPDGKYPVVYAERGMLGLSLTTDISDNSDVNLSEVSGDFSASYIPDKAKIKFSSGEIKDYFGKKSPSNAPDLGENALLKLAVEQQSLSGQLGEVMNWLYRATADTSGKKINISFTGKSSGKLQCSVYGMLFSKHQSKICFSIRYPIELTKQKLLDRLKKQMPSESQLTIVREVAPLYHSPNMLMIKIMQQVYEDVTGQDGSPVTTTGITYARFLSNIVAFGPSFPGQRGIAHKENEWLKTSDWKKIITMEYLTLRALAEREDKDFY